MKPSDKIAKAISRFQVNAPSHLDERVREHVYEVFSDPIHTPATEAATHRRRSIPSYRIAQLAAAAVVAVALLLGLYAWDLLGTQAYAVEDTVRALQKIEIAHAFCTDWAGRRLEMWIQRNPVTGRNDFISLVEPERDSVAVSTPHVSYIYNTRTNSLRFIRGQVMTSSLNLAGIVESLSFKAKSVTTTRRTTDQHGEVIAIHCVGPIYESEAWIDPRTKLLLRLEHIRCTNRGEVLKSMDEIRYSEPIPEELLHFQCPDDASIQPENWGDIDDPSYGIDATSLSDEQACRAVLMRLFDAINAADLTQLRQLVPIANQWSDEQLVTAIRQAIAGVWDGQPGLAGYEIGVPYQDKACPLGVLVPCVLTNHDGSQFEVTLIVRFRQTDGRRSCVVVYTWGQAKSLD